MEDNTKNAEVKELVVIRERERVWKLVNFCEFDKKPYQSYCAIHGVDPKLNLGDITKVDETKLEPFNFICGGSPCQDFSIAGKQKGSMWTCKECGHEYNPITQHWSKRDCCPKCSSKELDKSRSSLLVEWLRVVRANKPNFGIYENVKNITCGKHRETFDLFIQELRDYGYNVYWKVLIASDYNLPQDRQRVYVVFIKKELDNGNFTFPKSIELKKKIKDYIDFNCKNRKVNKTLLPYFDEKYYTDYQNKNGHLLKVFDGECQNIFNSDFTNKRIYSYEGSCPTITTNGNVNIAELKGQLTALEYIRLMGFDDDTYYKMKEIGMSDSYIHKQAGNSICVNVLCYIYLSIYKAMPYLFDDLKVSSFFSGIGAFEKALDKFYNYINK